MKHAHLLLLLISLTACGGGDSGEPSWQGVWTRSGGEALLFDNCGCISNTRIVFESLPVQLTEEDGRFNASIDECGLRCFTFIRFFGTAATESTEMPLSLQGAASGFECSGATFTFTENASTITFTAAGENEAEVRFDVNGRVLPLNVPEDSARPCEMRFSAPYARL